MCYQTNAETKDMEWYPYSEKLDKHSGIWMCGCMIIGVFVNKISACAYVSPCVVNVNQRSDGVMVLR